MVTFCSKIAQKRALFNDYLKLFSALEFWFMSAFWRICDQAAVVYLLDLEGGELSHINPDF
jgi:hypothetical protein